MDQKEFAKGMNRCLFLLRQVYIFLIPFILLLSLLGCTTQSELERAEAKWEHQDIQSYRIQVQVGGFWSMHNYLVIVRDGKVVDSSSTCIVAPGQLEPCQAAPFDPEQFTVPGLFAIARAQLASSDEWTTVEYDARYGYPMSIRYDQPQLADEEQIWSVLEFREETP